MNKIRKAAGFTLVEIMIVVAIIGILIAIAVPGFIRARSQSRQKACQENLVKIDGAKQQWALENNKKPSDTPNLTGTSNSDCLFIDDGTGYLKSYPQCPTDESSTYNVNAVNADPDCPTGQPGHSISDVGKAITDNES